MNKKFFFHLIILLALMSASQALAQENLTKLVKNIQPAVVTIIASGGFELGGEGEGGEDYEDGVQKTTYAHWTLTFHPS